MINYRLSSLYVNGLSQHKFKKEPKSDAPRVQKIVKNKQSQMYKFLIPNQLWIYINYFKKTKHYKH